MLEVTEMVIIHIIHLLRMLTPSSIAGLQAGAIIGLPPVLNFGSPEQKARVIPEVLSGKKFICLAISEAFAGSDVMGLKTTAKQTEDGKHWIITGTKKWITNGQYVEALYCYRGASERTESDSFADYFTVGCKTDSGFTVILVERGEGVVRFRRSRRATPQRLEQLMSRLTMLKCPLGIPSAPREEEFSLCSGKDHR